MVDVVGGGYPLGEPLGLAIDRARPEKFRVVVEPADHLGVTAAQAPHWKLDQPLDVRLQRRIALLEHFCSTSHRLKAPDRIDHLGTIDHVVEQIGYRVQIAATATYRGKQFEVVGRPQQLTKPRHKPISTASSMTDTFHLHEPVVEQWTKGSRIHTSTNLSIIFNIRDHSIW